MEINCAAVFASVQADKGSVTAVCERLRISRKSYYKYLSCLHRPRPSQVDLP